MTTTTVFAGTSDGYVYGSDTVYSTARSTASTASDADNDAIVGQRFLGGTDYRCYELFFQFDVSAVPDVASATAAVLSLVGADDQSSPDFTITAALSDWGSALTTADWVAGASLSGLTEAASRSTVGIALESYNAFTSAAGLLTQVQAAGNVRLLLFSSRHSGNNAPSGDELVSFYMSNQPGTTKDPKLVVTTPDAAAGQPTSRRFGGVPYAMGGVFSDRDMTW